MPVPSGPLYLRFCMLEAVMDNWSLGAAAPMLTREEYVAKLLREAILRAELQPGQRLDQTRIARELGVSRTPVRNALLILSNEGLVEMAPHAGRSSRRFHPRRSKRSFSSAASSRVSRRVWRLSG